MSNPAEFTAEELARYEQLADEAERGDLPAPEKTLSGDEAAQATQRMFLELFGTADVHRLADMAAPGRPSLGESATPQRGASPIVHLRLPAEMNRAIETLAERTQKNKSAVLRELIAEGLRHAS